MYRYILLSNYIMSCIVRLYWLKRDTDHTFFTTYGVTFAVSIHLYQVIGDRGTKVLNVNNLPIVHGRKSSRTRDLSILSPTF